MFATLIPGLARVVSRQLDEIPGVRVTDSGFDGRSDVVLFELDRGRKEAIAALDTAEDVFVEVGRTLRADGDRPHWIAGRIWRPARVEQALSVWAEQVHPLSAGMKYRVIARVLQERSFLRTDLRREFTRAVARERPKWKVSDPAQLEIWVSEYKYGQLVAGLRVSDVTMRQHGGRTVERAAALRPTLAAAMVRLAGRPGGTLLDPTCGSGTILSEAFGLGWNAVGRDIDPDAVAISRRNVPEAHVGVGDVRRIDLSDGAVRCCVANLPFGQRYAVEGDPAAWLRSALDEMGRVTEPGGRVVVLVPELPGKALPPGLRLRDRYPIRLLGTKTTIWVLDRAPVDPAA